MKHIPMIEAGDIITIGDKPFKYRAVEVLDEAGYKCIRLEWAGWTDAFIEAVDATGLHIAPDVPLLAKS